MPRPLSERAARRSRALPAILAVVLAVACRDATAPRARAEPVELAFVDNLFRLTLLRPGEAPVATGVSGVVPFAAGEGSVAYWERDTLRLFDTRTGASRTTPVVGRPAGASLVGAISPDGARIAFTSGAAQRPIHLHVLNLETGARDSVDIVPNTEPTTTLRILEATPVFSPEGDRVGFLMPTLLAMHFHVFETTGWRAEQHLLWVPTSTTVQPMGGWPRWMRDGTLRFVARRRSLDAVPVDTMMILQVDPYRGDLGALIIHQAAMPDSLSLEAPRTYSFTADGRTAAFAATANGRDGVFALREESGSIEPLVFGAAIGPRYPLVVP